MASGIDIHMPAPKFPVETSDGCAPHPAHIRQIGAGEPIRDVPMLVPLVVLFVTLAEPAPSGSTGTSLLCRAAPTLTSTSWLRLPPASPPGCDKTEAKVSHLLLEMSAPHGARGSRLSPPAPTRRAAARWPPPRRGRPRLSAGRGGTCMPCRPPARVRGRGPP